MAKAKPETIILKGNPLIKERDAVVALSPGHFVELTAANGVRKVDEAGASSRNIAIENDLLGKTISDAYAANDRVLYAAFTPGEEAYVRLQARATAVVVGDDLALSATGSVVKAAGGADVVARALEAIDNSANANEVFIKVEVA